MNNVFLSFDGAWRVLLASLVLGAGMPAVFALGVRALAFADAAKTAQARPAGKPLGRALAVLCFAVVLTGVALGITYIVASGFGKTISFEHVLPTLVNKK